MRYHQGPAAAMFVQHSPDSRYFARGAVDQGAGYHAMLGDACLESNLSGNVCPGSRFVGQVVAFAADKQRILPALSPAERTKSGTRAEFVRLVAGCVGFAHHNNGIVWHPLSSLPDQIADLALH
jgi:hypothetical protein